MRQAHCQHRLVVTHSDAGAMQLTSSVWAGAAYAQRDINEGDLKAQEKSSDAKTSALPTFGEVFKNFGGGSGAPGTSMQTLSVTLVGPDSALWQLSWTGT